MGFGHRIYKNFDPRAQIIKQIADEVFEVTGKNPLIDIAVELERIALQDDYFVSRKLYPNVDFFLDHLRGDALPAGPVSRAVRDRAHAGMARAMAGDAARQGPEDRPAAPGLHGGEPARLPADRTAGLGAAYGTRVTTRGWRRAGRADRRGHCAQRLPGDELTDRRDARPARRANG